MDYITEKPIQIIYNLTSKYCLITIENYNTDVSRFCEFVMKYNEQYYILDRAESHRGDYYTQIIMKYTVFNQVLLHNFQFEDPSHGSEVIDAYKLRDIVPKIEYLFDSYISRDK